MEDSCFSAGSKSKFKSQQSDKQFKKISSGLVYPAYIITSYSSSCLTMLQQELENENITVSFQSSIEYLRKIPHTYQHKYFIILNDFHINPILTGQLEKVAYQIFCYPKMELQQIIRCYRKFVERQEVANEKNPVNVRSESIQSNFNQNKSSIQSSNVSSPKITVRSISRRISYQKSSFLKVLFIYSNKRDQESYKQYLELITQRYQIENSKHIRSIEEYIQYLPQKGDKKYCILMGEYSAINLRRFFKKSDQILLFATNAEKCLQLLRGKVTELTADSESMNKIIGNSFRLILKNEFADQQHSSKSMNRQSIAIKEKQEDLKIDEAISQKKESAVSEKIQQITNIKFQEQKQTLVNKDQLCHQPQPETKSECLNIERSSDQQSDSNVSTTKAKSAFNFNIVQQYSMVSDVQKNLNLQSSILQYSITPFKQYPSSSQSKQVQLIKQRKICFKKKIKSSTPLMIVQMEAISLKMVNMESQANESFSFEDILNRLSSGKVQEINQTSAKCHSLNQADVQNSAFDNISKNSLSSCSSRSNKNSRIIQRIQEKRKENIKR